MDVHGSYSDSALFALCVFSEYAEALTNPIKHISELHKRETQLAVLIEDNNEVRLMCKMCGGLQTLRHSHPSFSPACPQPTQRGRAQEKE